MFLNPPPQPDPVNRTFLLGTIRTFSFCGDTAWGVGGWRGGWSRSGRLDGEIVGLGSALGFGGFWLGFGRGFPGRVSGFICFCCAVWSGRKDGKINFVAEPGTNLGKTSGRAAHSARHAVCFWVFIFRAAFWWIRSLLYGIVPRGIEERGRNSFNSFSLFVKLPSIACYC